MRCGRRRFFPYCCNRKIAVIFVDHPFTIHCYNGTNMNETFSQDYVSQSVNGENYFFLLLFWNEDWGANLIPCTNANQWLLAVPFFAFVWTCWYWCVSCWTYQGVGRRTEEAKFITHVWVADTCSNKCKSLATTKCLNHPSPGDEIFPFDYISDSPWQSIAVKP